MQEQQRRHPSPPTIHGSYVTFFDDVTAKHMGPIPIDQQFPSRPEYTGIQSTQWRSDYSGATVNVRSNTDAAGKLVLVGAVAIAGVALYALWRNANRSPVDSAKKQLYPQPEQDVDVAVKRLTLTPSKAHMTNATEQGQLSPAKETEWEIVEADEKSEASAHRFDHVAHPNDDKSVVSFQTFRHAYA